MLLDGDTQLPQQEDNLHFPRPFASENKPGIVQFLIKDISTSRVYSQTQRDVGEADCLSSCCGICTQLGAATTIHDYYYCSYFIRKGQKYHFRTRVVCRMGYALSVGLISPVLLFSDQCIALLR